MGLCAEFVGARTETVVSELQYIMANLVKRPHMQEAVQFILVAPAATHEPTGTNSHLLRISPVATSRIYCHYGPGTCIAAS